MKETRHTQVTPSRVPRFGLKPCPGHSRYKTSVPRPVSRASTTAFQVTKVVIGGDTFTANRQILKDQHHAFKKASSTTPMISCNNLEARSRPALRLRHRLPLALQCLHTWCKLLVNSSPACQNANEQRTQSAFQPYTAF